ncbi:LAFE_0G11826g1_1 [Lachancea fermentati]|uniref:LAFE_0G11826g1_1 n=1 Tax=Lachancea fermentati TaxID=4955 RepID=A0A1G4MHW5_LACFM|nr:LAFE_0G11826g1_1 [Lachancea fermentati]
MNVVKQLETVCYTAIFIRFVKDNSLTNVFLSLLLQFISHFVHHVIMMYVRLSTPNEEGQNHEEECNTIVKVLLRSMRYFQVVLLVQLAFLCWYHWTIDFEKQVCKWNYGYLFTDILGEFDCGRGGRAILLFLDVFILLMQLQMFTEELTKCRKNVDKVAQDVNITVGDLGIHKFGILSILRFNSFDKDNSEPQLSYDVGDQGEDENMGYGSTT